MKQDNLLLIFSIIVVVISLLAASFTYFSISDFARKITGYGTTANVNLSVESTAAINFTTDFINWGSGRVNPSSSAASLTTFGTNNVTGGNWTLQQAGGLRIENIGNTNVSLNLSGTKTAATFIGGTGPAYEWNISNIEGGSCLNATGGTPGLNLNTFHNVNTTTVAVCPRFRFESGNDLVRIDFNLTIPENSLTGALTDTITAIVVTV